MDTGEKIRCVALENFEQEAAAIYDYARRNPPKTANELCVVVRSNKYVAELSSVFEKLNNERKDGGRVEFFTAESHMRFYKKPVVKDALAVIRLALDGADEVSMERLSERFVARVGLKTLETLRKTLSCGLGVAAFSDVRAYRDGDEYAALLSALEGGRVVVYDTETTGLDLARDEAIQLAAIKIDANGNTIEHFERMIFPTVPIGRGAYETHGFDEAYIASHGGVTAKEAYASFLDFVRGCVLVGHNSARFDSPLVKRQLRDLGLPPLEIDEEYDTLILSRRIHSELPDHKLATLCARYGVVNEAAHDASGDIAATAKVLVGMVDSVLAPRTNERRQAFEEYRERFQKFFGFLQEVRGCIRENRLAEIMPLIVEKMHLESKYPEERGAINRLRAVFEGECTDDCEQFLRSYLTELSLYASRADALLGKNGALPIITVHQAKGCEFDTVIVAGADNRNFPSFMSRGTPDEDGEKKIFYVAITRAKKRLILTRPLYNGRYEVSPSPFVAKIPEKYLSKSERW